MATGREQRYIDAMYDWTDQRDAVMGSFLRCIRTQKAYARMERKAGREDHALKIEEHAAKTTERRDAWAKDHATWEPKP